MNTTTTRPLSIPGDIPPIVRINRHGYQRKTVNARATLYPLNTRIDKATHDHLKHIKEYYDVITGLNVRASVIMRRAIAVLGDYLKTAAPRIEQNEILNAGGND